MTIGINDPEGGKNKLNRNENSIGHPPVGCRLLLLLLLLFYYFYYNYYYYYYIIVYEVQIKKIQQAKAEGALRVTCVAYTRERHLSVPAV